MTEMIIIYSLISIVFTVIIFTIASIIFSKIFVAELYKILKDLKNEE